MSAGPAPCRIALDPGLLIADPEHVAALRAAGFERPWNLVRVRAAGPDRGRGTGAEVRGAGGDWFVKQYLRGGLPARWNRERYLAAGRFAREVAAGMRARELGLPVVATAGVRLVPARPGWRAWGAAPLFAGAEPLSRAVAGLAADDAERLWRAAFDAIAALHRAGFRHADLNLGNLLARRGPDGAWDVRVIDLDRVSVGSGPLSAGRARAVLARLERSWRKLGGPGPVSAAGRARLAERAGLLPAADYPA